MSVFFLSDPHFGHQLATEHRGFTSAGEHDEAVLESINGAVRKRDKLFLLGDVVFNKPLGESILPRINCSTIELIIGNHDKFSTGWYARYFHKVHGFRKYENFWISHCPIHPQEMYRCDGNIHGHIHKGGKSPHLKYPYFNVGWDFHRGPCSFDLIRDWFAEHEKPAG